MGTFSYQWERDDSDISGATTSTYTLVQGDNGKEITVTVTYIDGQGTRETVTSESVVVNKPSTGYVTIDGEKKEGSTLTANINQVGDGDGLPETFSYQWQRRTQPNDIYVDVRNGTGSTYTLTADEVGEKVRVIVSYTDNRGTEESIISQETIHIEEKNNPATGKPKITGEPKRGETLGVDTNEISDPDGTTINVVDGKLYYEYQWFTSDNVELTNKSDSNSTYTLTQNDVDKLIYVTVSFSDDKYNNETVTSDPIGPVEHVNTLPSTKPTITNETNQTQGEAPKQGDILTAVTSTITDADGIPDNDTFTYQWNRDGEAIDGSTSSTYTLTQEDVGKKVSVTVTYRDEKGTEENVTSDDTGNVDNVNDSPVGKPIIRGVPKEDDTLTVDTSEITDADGLGTFTYLWSNGETGESITLKQTDVGKQITVTVSYTDSQGTTEDVTSDPTNAVANVNDDPDYSFTFTMDGYTYETPIELKFDGTDPAPRGPYTSEEGFTIPGDTLSYTFTVEDADDFTSGTFEYKWYNDNGVIENATSTSYTVTNDDVGQQIYAVITYTDGQETKETLTSQKTKAVISGENNPVQGKPVLSGEAKQNTTLTTSLVNISDADGFDKDTVSYIWFRTGVKIGGEESATYTTTQEDVGKKITVKVTYRDARGVLETSEASNEIGPIEDVNDPLTGPLEIQGTVKQYETLTLDESKLNDIDGMPSLMDEDAKYTRKWYRDGVEIIGDPNTWTNKREYTLTQEDVGKMITASVSYVQTINGTAYEHSITSAEYGPVENVNDPPTGEVIIEGIFKEGQTLTANTSTLGDKDGLGNLTYKWKREGNPINEATNSTYTLTRDDVNKFIKVTVYYTDGENTPEEITSERKKATLVFQNRTDMDTIYNEWYEDSEQTTTKYGPENTWGTEKIEDFSCVFNGRIADNHPDISKWNTSNATNMDGLFSFSNINQPIETHIENENIYWDMSNVQSTIGMFYGNLEFNQRIRNWYLPSLRYAQYMFSASRFNKSIKTNSDDTTGVKTYYEGKGKIYMAWDMERVEDMRYMFANNLLFNQPISNWSTYQAKLEGMFYNAMVFNQLIGENVQYLSNAPSKEELYNMCVDVFVLMKQIHITLTDIITDLPLKTNFKNFIYTQIPAKLKELEYWSFAEGTFTTPYIRRIDIENVTNLLANCYTIAHNIVRTCNSIMNDIDKEKFTPYYNQLVDYCYGKDGFKGKLSFYVAWYTGSVENMNHFLHNARLYNRGVPHGNNDKQDIIKTFANDKYYKRNENEELKVRYGDKVITYKKDSTVDGQYKFDSTTDVGSSGGSVGGFGSDGFDSVGFGDDDDYDDSGFTITYNGSDFTTSTRTFDIAETLNVSYENKEIEINTSKGNTYSLTMYSYNELDNNANFNIGYTVAPFSILDTLFLRYSNECTEDNFSAFTKYIANSILNSNSTLSQQTERSEEGNPLANQDFSNKELTRTNYTGADLQGTNFTNANLIRANFAETKMNSETNFTDATLNEVKSGGITMSNGNEQPILPDGYKLIDGYIMGPYVDVSKTGGLESSNLENMNLRGVNLEKNNLTNAKLDGVKSRFIKSDDNTQLPENYVIKDGFLLGPKVNLVKENLRNLDLTEANLTEVNSEGANFSNTKLNNVDFTQTNLKQAILRGADLTSAEMDGTNIESADLRDVTFTNTRGKNIISNDYTTLPVNYVILNKFLLGPDVSLQETTLNASMNLSNLQLTRVNFESAKLSKANLTNTNFKNANLKKADLGGSLMKETNLIEADLRGADLTGITSENIVDGNTQLPEFYKIIKKHLVGPSVKLDNIDFEGVDFRGTSLQEARLLGANLKGANLTGVNLSDAYLNNVTSGNITPSDATISDEYRILNGYIIGPAVNIEGEEIGSGTLSNVDFNIIKIAGANLSGLTFKNVKTRNIKTYSGVQLSEDYKIFGDSIIGPGVDISYEKEDFKNADLTNMRLIDTNFHQVDFSNATLTGLQTSGIDGFPSKLPNDYRSFEQKNGKTYIIGPDVDLTNMDLSGFDLSLRVFDGIISGGNIDSTGTKLPDNYKFIRTASGNGRQSEDCLFGPKVKLVNKDLVIPGNLNYFDNAILYDSDFSLSTFGSLGGTYLSGTINQAILSDVKFTNGKIVGTINDSTLTGADLSGTDASEATFKEIISGNVTVNQFTKLPENTRVTNGYIIAEKSVLAGADLNNADLSGAHVKYGNFTNASLVNASLKEAKLFGADFDQADLTGANIEDADLTEASLFEVKSDNIIVNSGTKLPSGYRIVGRRIEKIDSSEE